MQQRGAIAVLQKVFKFRTCSLDIDDGDEKWRWFRPCLLASINQCTAPCNLRISKDEYRDRSGGRACFWTGKASVLKELRGEMQIASRELKFEKAARLRDEIKRWRTSTAAGNLEDHVQPEVFYIDPKKVACRAEKVLNLPVLPRTIEGVDIAHLHGGETVASLVQFIDGLPFKHGHGYGSRSAPWTASTTSPSMREVVSRRFRRLRQEETKFPDILLVDGGLGQLNAAPLR
ncbi:MAG: UvrB/UvrC motif-containing protein [Planctomycetaceae bacterium]